MNNPHKGDVIRLLLETEGRIMLCLDATYSGVDVPSRFKKDFSLMLILNANMPQPIHIEKESVSSELRFGGIPHYCVIPFDALWCVFNPDSSHGMVWPESMPAEVLRQHGLSSFNGLTLPDIPVEMVEGSHAKSPFQVIEGGAVTPKKTAQKSSLKAKPNLKLVE
ncbi:MAG: hypothetical protein HQL67_05980 [Magnetococcales bacterium]|nr:hypothetical protein [Magnetococcales bacterium]